ncbi:MAG: hypothetical protein ACPG43_08685, partial [Alcanivoracaceae bacterium]
MTSDVSSKPAAKKSPGGGATAPGTEVDVRWIMRELLDEQRVTQEQFNVISTTPREKSELSWHPLEVV